ncbi:hypothetical protein OT109_02430 [Phycisphaeraceae bacterium D3-23]
MQHRFHPQSMMVGGVVSAVLTTMILPAFGNKTPHGAADKQNDAVREVVVQAQRYEIIAIGDIAYLLDTETGEVWRNQNATSRRYQTTDHFYEEKD